jgi:hypothetical protein
VIGAVGLLRQSLPRLASIVALSCGFPLLLLPAAEARIVPQRGIAGIHLEMTRAQVVRAKGRPDADRVIPNEILGRQRELRYGRTRVYFGGTRRDAGVVSVRTTDRRQRTRTGVGVGSREAAVRVGVFGIRCRTESGFRHCWKGHFLPGRRVTDFRIGLPRRRVTEVTIGFVID